MKRCHKCKQDKSLSEFHRNKAKKDGLDQACKICRKAITYKYYEKNPAKKTWRRNLEAEVVVEHMKSFPCSDCKNTFPPCVMDFDHVKDKKIGVAKMASRGFSLKEILLEISKCELVCASCHRIRTHTRAGRKFLKYRDIEHPLKNYSSALDMLEAFQDFKKNKKKPKKIVPRKPRKTKSPPREILEDLIWKLPTTKIGQMFGVSDKAVEKWCKKYHINKPSRGFWQKHKLRIKNEIEVASDRSNHQVG